MKQTYIYIVSWTISISSFLPCKSVGLLRNQVGNMTHFVCSETEQTHFSLGFSNRDSAMIVYKNCIHNEITTAKFDSVLNK